MLTGMILDGRRAKAQSVLDTLERGSFYFLSLRLLYVTAETKSLGGPVGSIADLLKNLPEAAQSPLAFVAYCLVVAAWLIQRWLALKPQRDAKSILNTFKDDQLRLSALTEIFNEPPPRGLEGNQAILDWVRVRSAEKTKVLLVVAWLATLVAVLIFLVAVRNAASNSQRVPIAFYRIGGAKISCPLPEGARINVISKGKELAMLFVTDCKTTLSVEKSQNVRAILTLADSGAYKLADPEREYELAAPEWKVPLQGPLQVTLFNYSGQCPDLERAFDTFETIVRSKANSLRGMFAHDDKRFDYLSLVDVVRTGEQFALNNAAAHDYWQKTGSIQLLAGLCKGPPQNEVMKSQIFFGDLKGKLPSESFEADLALSPDEFGSTRDIHTATILYALAQEAMGRQLPTDLVIDYLAEAHAIAIQIDSDSGKQLQVAIDGSLKEMNAPKPLELHN
jgi:hypothetical protein